MPVFTEHGQISEWALTASIALAEAGVINGSNNRFNPQLSATRAEVATMFRNFMRLVVADNESNATDANTPTATLGSTMNTAD